MSVIERKQMFWDNICREHSCCYSVDWHSCLQWPHIISYWEKFLLFGQHGLIMLYLKNILIWLHLYEIKCNPNTLIFCLIMHISHTVLTTWPWPWHLYISPEPFGWIADQHYLVYTQVLFLVSSQIFFLDLTTKHILWSCILSPSGF